MTTPPRPTASALATVRSVHAARRVVGAIQAARTAREEARRAVVAADGLKAECANAYCYACSERRRIEQARALAALGKLDERLALAAHWMRRGDLVEAMGWAEVAS